MLLKRREPLGVHVKHTVGPLLVMDRVAGMHRAGIHEHHAAGTDQTATVTVEVGALSPDDGANGERRMGMARVTEAATVLDVADFQVRNR